VDASARSRTIIARTTDILAHAGKHDADARVVNTPAPTFNTRWRDINSTCGVVFTPAPDIHITARDVITQAADIDIDVRAINTPTPTLNTHGRDITTPWPT
jgi:hypothetical protein